MIYNLEALRGICAIAVAIYHIPWATHLQFLPYIQNAWLFVDFFFVLSGFIIAKTYADRPDFNLRTFMIRRFFRLYPLHVVTLLAVFAMVVVRDGVIPQMTGLPSRMAMGPDYYYVFFLNIMLAHAIGFTDTSILNTPSWSVSVEFYTYLIFGLIASAFRQPGSRAFWMGAVGLAAAATLMALNPGGGLTAPVSLRLLRCLLSFGLGASVWWISTRGLPEWAPRWYDGSYIALLTGLAVAMSTVGEATPWNLIYPPVFGLVIYLFVADTGSTTRTVMETAPMKALGAWSYSIYMVHAFIVSIFGFVLNRYFSGSIDILNIQKRLATPLWFGDFMAIFYIVCVLVVSCWTYRFIEDPARKWGNRLAGSLLSRQVPIAVQSVSPPSKVS